MTESPPDHWVDPWSGGPRRRGARAGRGWDAAPRRTPRAGGDTRTRRDPARHDPAHGDPAHGDPAHGDPAHGDPARRDPAQRDSAPRRRGAGVRRDPAEEARDICLNQLAVRPRTRQELAAVLRRRGVSAEVAAEVLDRYGEVGIIDDRAFASAWVSSRHHGKGLARRALAGELRRKGVDGALIDGALGELDREVELDTARDLVRRRLRASGSTPRPVPGARTPERADARFRRLVGLLARKGYPPGLAVGVVREVLSEAAAEDAADLADEGADLDAIAESLDLEAMSLDAEATSPEVDAMSPDETTPLD